MNLNPFLRSILPNLQRTYLLAPHPRHLLHYSRVRLHRTNAPCQQQRFVVEQNGICSVTARSHEDASRGHIQSTHGRSIIQLSVPLWLHS